MDIIQEIETLQQEIRELENLSYEYLDEPKESNKINAALKERYNKLKILQSVKGQNDKKPIQEEKEVKKEETIKDEKVQEIIYETFNDPNLNCNQWVIEIHKAGNWGYENGKKKFYEDFSIYDELFYSLHRLGEQKACLYALLYYLKSNQHMFNFVLWRANFEKITGYKEKAYKDAINGLFYYGVLEATNRVKRNKQGVCCKVYLLRLDLGASNLPKEKFNARDPEHLKIAKERKECPSPV